MDSKKIQPGGREKNPAAVALGRLGGKARAKKLSQAERSESARKAVQVRLKSMTPEERSEAMSKAAKALANSMTQEQRTERARKAVATRWAKRKQEKELAQKQAADVYLGIEDKDIPY